MLRNPVLRAPLAISLGAIAGALSRYYLAAWVTQWLGTDFPYGTWIINLSGCFVMGCFVTLSLGQVKTIAIHPEVRLMVATGFLGSYTTFSSYELESVKLMQHPERQWLYWASSVVLGYLCLQSGAAIANWIVAQVNPGDSE